MIIDELGPWADGTVLRDAKRIDLAIYRGRRHVVPGTRRRDALAVRRREHSKLWLTAAAAMALVGGRRGRH